MNWYYPDNAAMTLPHESYGIGGLTLAGNALAAGRHDAGKSAADLAFVHLGHNDVSATGVSMSGPAKTAMRGRYADLVEGLCLAGKVVVPVPLVPTTTTERNEVLDFNLWMKDFARKHGLVLGPDLFTVVDGQQGTLTTDGTHLNGAGVKACGIAANLWLRRYLPKASAGALLLRDSSASQPGVVANFAGKTTNWGSYGYGSAEGTFSAAAVAADSEATNGSWRFTKTGGDSCAVTGVLDATTGFAVGDWVMTSFRFKSECLAGGSYLVSDLKAVGGHGGAYRTIHGQPDFDDWARSMTVFKVPAGTTGLSFGLYMRRLAGSGSSTGTFEIADAGVWNLSAMGVAAGWGLV